MPHIPAPPRSASSVSTITIAPIIRTRMVSIRMSTKTFMTIVLFTEKQIAGKTLSTNTNKMLQFARPGEKNSAD
nr:hypothetical protein [Acidovorax sp. CCYZU-2555]